MFQISWNITVKSKYNRIVTNMFQLCLLRISPVKLPHSRALAARIIYAKSVQRRQGKLPHKGRMHTPYGLRQLVQGHIVPTTSSSTTGTGTATKSVKAASTSRGGQCEQPSHVHGVRLGLMKGRKQSKVGKRLVMADRKGHA